MSHQRRARSSANRRRARGGFTLIELLAVVFILGLGLTSVSMLFVAGIVSSSKSQRISIASRAAEKQMEMLRSAGFAGCIVDSDVFSPGDGYTILEQQADKTGRIGFAVPELPGGQGVIEIRRYQGPTGYYPNLKSATVTVTWQGGGPTAGQTSLQTLIANRP